MNRKLGPWHNSSVRWVCEEHPAKDHEHRLWFGFGPECGGAGEPEHTEENIRKGYVFPSKQEEDSV